MKKSLVIILVLAYLPCYAQLKGFSLGPYAELAWPTSDFEKTNKNGLGAGLGADIGFGKLKLTGSVGFIHFGGKTVSIEGSTVDMPAINAIPIRAGFKYRFVPLFYAKLEGGVARYTDGDNSAFILSPGIGLRLLGWDVLAKYETWMKDGAISFWGLKAGYNF